MRGFSFIAALIVTVSAIGLCGLDFVPTDWKLTLLAIYSIGAALVCLAIIAIHSHFAFCGRSGRWFLLAILLLPLIAVSFEYRFNAILGSTVWFLVGLWAIATLILMGNAPVPPPFLSVLTTTTGIICLILSLGRLTWLIPYSSDLLTQLSLLGYAVDIRRLIGIIVGSVFVFYALIRALRRSLPHIPVIPLPTPLAVPPGWPKLIQSILVPLVPAYNWTIRIGVAILNIIWVTVAALGLIALRVSNEVFQAILEVWANGTTLRYTLSVGVAFVSALLLVFLTVIKIPQETLNYLTAPADTPVSIPLVSWVLLGIISILGILRVWHRPGTGHVYHAMSALTVLCVHLVAAAWLIHAVVRFSAFRTSGDFTWVLTGPGPLLIGGTIFVGIVFIIFYFGHFKQHYEEKSRQSSDG